MLPSSVSLRNYRSFPGPQELELRPITLLFGSNNVGKSSLLRSLPLLADSLASDSIDALDLSQRIAPLSLDFDTIRRKGRAAEDDHDIGIGLSWPESEVVASIGWSIVDEPDWYRTVVSAFHVTLQDGSRHDLAWVPQRADERSHILSYRVNGREKRVGFKGLLPVDIPKGGGGVERALRLAAEALSELKGAVLWLRSLRPAPERFTRWTGAVRWELEPTGTDAAIVLASEPELQEEVSSWYERNFGARLAIDEPRKREVRALLRQRFDIDMADTGEGLSQCLPVITAFAMARRRKERGGPAIVAIEEPEAHLHPTVQRALAERACETAAAAKPRIVFETHSEHILLTVQLAVVKELLRPEDVVLYWIRSVDQGQSVASKVELDANGRFVGDWPPTAFDDDRGLAAEILDAREQKRVEP